jgi:hypothetical protein
MGSVDRTRQVPGLARGWRMLALGALAAAAVVLVSPAADAFATGSCSGVGIAKPTASANNGGPAPLMGQQAGSTATCTPRWRVLEHWQYESGGTWHYVNNLNTTTVHKQWFPGATDFWGAGTTHSWRADDFSPSIFPCNVNLRIEAFFFNTVDGSQIHHQYSSQANISC